MVDYSEIARLKAKAERERSEAFARHITTFWEEVRKLERPALQAAVIVLTCVFVALFLTGCVETRITAVTPCGVVTYYSTKDHVAPAAECNTGAAYLTIGADKSAGVGAVAGAVTEAAIKALGVAKP